MRVPVVPDSSPNVQRFAFGQEIPEGTMVRLFTLPARTLTVDADTCRILDDPWAQLSRRMVPNHSSWNVASRWSWRREPGGWMPNPAGSP